MKFISSFPLYIVTLALMAPLPSHAEIELPYWMSPDWIQRKLSDLHTRNLARYENEKSNSANSANLGANSAQNNAQHNAPYSPDQQTNVTAIPATTTAKTVAIKAPVENATPKINEKHLTPEELKELRRQLRQPR